jgi:uncharacterized membrane protein
MPAPARETTLARVRLRRASPYLLAAFLSGAGVLHFVAPEPYERLVPPFLGAPRPWIYGSGIAEIACAVATAAPRTRRKGAMASAALLLAVFPANVYMAVEPGDVPRWLALARLPLQVPLVLWALQVARDSGRRG